jgi:hypothetical protein
MADTIVDGTNFNVENIRYSAPKAGGSGGKSVNILNKSTNSGLRVSTPLLLTWGASDFIDAATGKGNGKYEMALQFPSEEYKTEDATAFLQTMMAFENKIKQDALTYSKEWFGKVHKNAEVINALWTPMLKYSKDKFTGEPDLSKAPVLRVKLPFWENVWKCEIYDEDNNSLFPNVSNPTLSPIDFIQKGTNVAILMQCGGLWFANGKFGMTWKLIQAMTQKPRASLTGKCFINLKAGDKEKLKKTVAVSVDADPDCCEGEGEDEDMVVAAAVNNTEVDDSDEEEEAAPVSVFKAPPVVAAPVPTPVPVPMPKAVVAEVASELESAAATTEPKKVVKKVVKKKVAEA